MDLTEGRLFGIPTPPPPSSVGGIVTPASLQASLLPVYWLFYTVKSNNAEPRSHNHLGTHTSVCPPPLNCAELLAVKTRRKWRRRLQARACAARCGGKTRPVNADYVQKLFLFLKERCSRQQVTSSSLQICLGLGGGGELRGPLSGQGEKWEARRGICV